MSQKCIHGIEVSGQFSLGKKSMNLAMTNPVQELGMPATFGLGYQVMGIALALGNLAPTKRTHQIHSRSRNPLLLK